MANIGDLELTLTVKDNLSTQLKSVNEKVSTLGNRAGKLEGAMRDVDAALNKLVGDYGKLTEAAQKAYNKGLDVKNFANSAKEVEGILKHLQAMEKSPKLLGGDNAVKVFLADITKVRTEIQNVTSASEKMMSNMRNISEMQSKLGVLQRSAEKVSGNGLALGVSTAGLDKAINDAKTLITMLSGVNVQTLGVGGNLSLADYGKWYNEITRALREAVAAQKELNAAQTKANNQSAKDAAKAARDDAKAEKQRQKEIEQSLVRIQALQRALRELWSTRQQSRSLGIDTTRIDKEIQSTIDKIRQLQAISGGLQSGNLMYLGRMGSTGNGREVRAIRETVTAQKELNAATIASGKAQADLASRFEQVSNAASHTNGMLSQMKNYLQSFVGFDGIRRLVDSIINVGGLIEMQHIGLQTIIGDLQNANEIWGQIKGLALQSPYTFSQLTQDVKQLAAYGVETEELYDTTKRLADVASGVNVSFERIALAYGQTMARAKLDGKELRQFSNAGIPILSELAKYYKETRGLDVNEGQVRKMTFAGDVSFEDVKAVFKKMTDEGGRFYNMQLVQSETLYGRMNKLKDAWEIMLSEFASKDNAIGGTFSHILDGLTTIVQKVHELLPVITGMLIPKIGISIGNVLKNSFGFTGKQVGANILASKGSLANDYQKRILAGEKLKGTEAKILQYKNQIRIQDVKALYNAGAITKQDVQRLIVAKQITREQGKQLIGQSAYNARMSLFMGGLKNLGSGILSFFGGLPGIAIGAIAATIAYWYNKNEQIKEQTKKMQEELAQRQRSLTEGTTSIKKSVTTAKASNDIASLSESYEELKKQIEDISPVILARKLAAEDKHTFVESLDYLVKVNEELAKTLEYAQTMSNVFPNAAEDANGWFTEDIPSNIKDLEKRLRKYEEAKRHEKSVNVPYTTVKTSKTKLAADEAFLYGRDLTSQYSEVAKTVMAGFGDEWKDNLDAAWVMLENWMSQVGMSEEMKQFARIQFSFEWGDEDFTSLWPKIKKKLGEQIANDDSGIGKSINEKILSGEGLTDAEEAYAKTLVWNIAKSISDNPALPKEVKEALLKAFGKESVAVKIVAQLTGNDGKPWKAFLKRELHALSNDPDNKIRLMIDQAGTISDLWAAVQKAHDNAEEEIKKLKGIKLPIGVTFSGKKISYEEALRKGGVWDDWVKSKNGGKGFDKKKVARANEIISYVEFLNDLVDTVSSTEDFAKKEGYDLEANKKGGNKDGNKKDTVAEKWRNRLSVMKEYADEYEKLVARVGKEEAASQMDKRSKEMGWNSILPGGFDRSNPRQSIRDYYTSNVKNKAKTDQQKSVAKDYAKTLFGFDDDDAKKAIESSVGGIQKALSEKSKKWSLFNKAKESTGSASVAIRLAFGGGTDAENAVEDYRKMLSGYLKKNGIGMSVDDILGMSDEDILNSLLGERFGKPIVEMAKSIREAEEKEAERMVTNYLRILKEAKSYADQIADLDRQELVDLADMTKKGATQEEKDKLSASYNEKRGTLLFKQFQKSSDWEKLFDDLGRISNTTLNDFEQAIKKFATTAGLGATETKSLVNAIKKVREEQISRNPFKYIMEGFMGVNTIRGYMEANKPDANGMYNVTKEAAQAMGISKTGNISGKELKKMSKDRDAENTDNFVKGLSAAAKALEAFEGVLKPVSDLFEAMGDDTMAEATKIGSNAFSSAANTASSFASLSNAAEGAGLSGVSSVLGKAGAYGAAASAALSVTTSLFGLHDKAIQKQIEASKQREKEAANIFKNLKEALSDSFGGFYSGDVNYSDMLAALITQRDEKVYQLRKEQSQHSGRDKSYESDLKQEITEANETIKDFASDMAKDLYGIDFKSYASSLSDALVNAWAEGSSAAKAYGDAVNEIMKNVVASVVKQKYIEQAIEPLAKDFMQKFADNGGVVDESMMSMLSQIYDIGESAASASNAFMDNMEYIANQHGETLKNSSTGTLANGIESITEDTADLLAGYINSIRADTSILRVTNTEILKAVQGMGSMPVIARSQLEQLNVIAANTGRSAESAEMIYNILNRVTNGSLQLAVK